MKSVFIALPPKQCDFIEDGKCKVLLQKVAPKYQALFKCYIYQTDTIEDNILYCYQTMARCKKVIGEFVCKNVEEFNVFNHKRIAKLAYLTDKELIDWFYTPEELEEIQNSEYSYQHMMNDYAFALHISNLIMYNKPKRLKRLLRIKKINKTKKEN